MGIRAETLIIAASVWLALVGAAASEECREDRIDLRGDWGQASFSVEVADTNEERSQGLMNRESMDTLAGMLFVYDHPQPVSFWMRNTLIPLDMIFADGTGTVRRVHENAMPLDETPIPGGTGIQFVLEVNGGVSSTFGIDEGTEMRHPSIADPAWACD